MSNKLTQLRERGVIRDEIHSFSDLVFAEGMRQIHPDRVFIDVSKDERSGPYLQASEADADRLEAEGYRRLNMHPKELALLSEARRLAGMGIQWSPKRTPMYALLSLAIKAGVVDPGTTAEDLLKISRKSNVRTIGKPGGAKRVILTQLTAFAVLWTYVSRRLNPQAGWGPAEELAEETRSALDAWPERELLDYINAQHKVLQGGLTLALSLAINGREKTKKGAAENKKKRDATDEKIRLAAKKYMTGRNWKSRGDASSNIAVEICNGSSYVQQRLSALYPGDAWPPNPKKPRKA